MVLFFQSPFTTAGGFVAAASYPGETSTCLDPTCNSITFVGPIHPDMLYQLSVYALSQAECRTATILYATTTHAARNARTAITDPIHGGTRARTLSCGRSVCQR